MKTDSHIHAQRDKHQQHTDLGYYYHIREIIPPTPACISVLQREPHTMAMLRATPYHSRHAESHLRGPASTAPHPCSSLPQHIHRYYLILKPARMQPNLPTLNLYILSACLYGKVEEIWIVMC